MIITRQDDDLIVTLSATKDIKLSITDILEEIRDGELEDECDARGLGACISDFEDDLILEAAKDRGLIPELKDYEPTLKEIHNLLCDRYGINHLTEWTELFIRVSGEIFKK